MKRQILIGLVLLMVTCLGLTFLAFSQGFATDKKISSSLMTLKPSAITTKIEKKESGLYYFGFSACPWCRELLPHLQEKLETNAQKAYFVDTKSDGFTARDREKLLAFYTQYTGKENLQVPLLVAINDKGAVKIHVGTVEGHQANMKPMTQEQLSELMIILQNLIDHLRH